MYPPLQPTQERHNGKYHEEFHTALYLQISLATLIIYSLKADVKIEDPCARPRGPPFLVFLAVVKQTLLGSRQSVCVCGGGSTEGRVFPPSPPVHSA